MLTAQRGRLVTIRVNDPAKLVSLPVGVNAGSALAIHMTGPTALSRSIPIISRDTGGWNHGIVIPYQTACKLWIQSSTLSLQDDKGKPLTAQASIGVNVAYGDAPLIYIVNVVGTGKP